MASLRARQQVLLGRCPPCQGTTQHLAGVLPGAEQRWPRGRIDTKRSDWSGGRAGASTSKAFSGLAPGVAGDRGDDLAGVQRTKRSAVIGRTVSSSSGRRSRAA